MSEWKTYKLGEICTDISYGYTESASSEMVGPKFLRITDIQHDFINWNNVPYCPITESNHNKYKLEVGDIVIARTGASTGATAIFKDADIDAVYASYLIRYKIDKSKADPFYIGHLLKSPLWKQHVNSIIGGSGQPGANAKQFASFKIEIPDLPTQRQIAQILSSLDDKIELNLQMNQTLEAMAQAIFKEWFVNFNFPGFDGELVDGLPKGWNRCLIKDFGKIVCGKTPSKAVKEYFGGEYMFIKIPDMHNSVFIIETTDSLTEEGLNSQSNKTIPPFSICVSSIATVGLVCINPEPCQTNQQINSIVPKNKDSRYFLYFLTTSMKDTFLATASGGTATLNMNTSQFSNIGAFMPGEDILKEFDVIVSPIMEKILENEYNIKSLTQTRDTLLPKLMSGKISLNL